MSDNYPLATVIMPTYNGAAFIKPAVQSILNQTWPALELVIVDDASSDSTVRIVQKIAGECKKRRIRLIRHERNQGISAATNTALANAAGEYILPMDHDDIALPTRVAACVQFLQQQPELSGCGAQHVVLKRSALLNRLKIMRAEARSAPLGPEEVFASSLFGGMLFNPTVCFRSDLLKLMTVHFDPALSVGADNDFYARAQQAGAAFAVLPQVVTLYRRHGGNASLKNREAALNCRQMISKRAVLALLPDADEDELALHARLVVRDKSISPDDLPGLRNWFMRLLASPPAPLDPQKNGLKSVLALNWNRACVLAGLQNFAAGWRAYAGLPELTPWLPSRQTFLYQYQKRKLTRIFKGR
ncbi:MAG: glycosyltransferase family 2 protein [Desulfovibrionaceae bacterium]|nr:glycosyltransferase family 2 protein [Desulfovibrionaceae bacterium]